ncbi:unnamed protein product, partial [Owenia fusiformis]
PCFSKAAFDFCNNKFPKESDTYQTCSPDPPKYESKAHLDEEAVASYEPCFDVECPQKKTFFDCLDSGFCTWCRSNRSDYGDDSKGRCVYSKCSIDGNSDVCEMVGSPSEVIDTAAYAGGFGALGVILIIVVVVIVVVIHKRRQRKNQHDEFNDVPKEMNGL